MELTLANVLQAQGKCAEANPFLREAVELHTRATPQDTAQIVELRRLLTSCGSPGER